MLPSAPPPEPDDQDCTLIFTKASKSLLLEATFRLDRERAIPRSTPPIPVVGHAHRLGSAVPSATLLPPAPSGARLPGWAATRIHASWVITLAAIAAIAALTAVLVPAGDSATVRSAPVVHLDSAPSTRAHGAAAQAAVLSSFVETKRHAAPLAAATLLLSEPVVISAQSQAPLRSSLHARR
jgi:hypothetical protein